jgi:hypothetical protein
MSQLSLANLTKALTSTVAQANIAPTSGPGRSTPKSALKRCCAAWQRAFKAHMDAHGNDPFERSEAASVAASAYCNAMPLLTGSAGVRDFVACAAHGILIGAIPHEKSGPLLYAAQVAISSLRNLTAPAARKHNQQQNSANAKKRTLPPPPKKHRSAKAKRSKQKG